jgi:pimeloyl-ACP methyl ester carboxylesterase
VTDPAEADVADLAGAAADHDDQPDPVAVIADLNQITSATGVDETRVVELGGLPHVVSIRGRRRGNPVLLVVHGGPGTPLAPTAWMWQRPVEEYFTVVHYDQRAAGRTHALTDPDIVRPTLDPAQYVADAVELAAWLTVELDVETVAVCGHSWGTAVATLAVVERPDLFSVYVGVGQLVSLAEGEPASWRWAREEADRRGLVDAVAELDALQPYPGDPDTLLEKVVVERGWVQRLGGFGAGRDGCAFFMDGDVLSPDYTSADRDALQAGNALTAEVLLPKLADLDLGSITSFPVPMVQLLGRHDAMTPPGPVEDWLAGLEVPSLVVEWFDDSAHMAMYEEPGHFFLALMTHVLPHARHEG